MQKWAIREYKKVRHILNLVTEYDGDLKQVADHVPNMTPLKVEIKLRNFANVKHIFKNSIKDLAGEWPVPESPIE